jgi:hypothetical protein
MTYYCTREQAIRKSVFGFIPQCRLVLYPNVAPNSLQL